MICNILSLNARASKTMDSGCDFDLPDLKLWNSNRNRPINHIGFDLLACRPRVHREGGFKILFSNN